MAFSLLRRLSTLSSRHVLRASLAILVGASLLTAGCGPKPVPPPVKITDPKDPKFVVAEKDGWIVTRAELDKQVKSFMDQKHITPEIVGAKLPALESMMLDNIILKKLILDKAAQLKVNADDLAKEEATQLTNAKGPDSDEVFAKKLKDNGLTLDELKKLIHEKLLVGKVIESEVGNIEPTEEEVNDIYVKNKEHFVTPPKVRASNILVHVDEKATPEDKAKAKKKIDKAYARVKGGEAFSKVATEMSEDADSAPKGGDLNYHQKGENEEKFDEVAFSTKEGKVSAVFETPAGYEFIKVTGVQPEGQLALADVRVYIVKRLKEMKGEKAERAFAEKLLKDSKVNVYIVRVDPNAPPAGAPGPVPEAGEPAPAPGGGPAPAPEPPPAPTLAPAPAPATATPPAPSVPAKK